MKRLMMTLAAALAAMVVAAPVAAQGATLTSPGRVGPNACEGGHTESTDPLTATISGVGSAPISVVIDAYDNLYSALRAQVGDGGPTSFPLLIRVSNAKTGVSGGTLPLRTINSGTSSLNRSTTGWSSLNPNTPYVFTIETTASGFGESRPLVKRCFMMGGTYTPANNSTNTALGSTGCFSISPRTPADVRNCLCGRSRIWTNDARNTADRKKLGCAN